MARNVVAPEASIWRTIGSTLAAKASAASRLPDALAYLALANGGPVARRTTARENSLVQNAQRHPPEPRQPPRR
jgi:hypothetical protein